MTRKAAISLLATLCLLVAALVSLAQPVTIVATHAVDFANISTVVENHGHVHAGDLDQHNPSDHVHDVAHAAVEPQLPVAQWELDWPPPPHSSGSPPELGVHDRPPRSTVAV